MEHPRRSTTPVRLRPAQGRASVRGAIYPASRARAHDAVAFLHVSSDWDHVKFREYVISHAKRAKVAHDQASLSKLTRIDSGLLGRYFRGEVQPGEVNLERIQRAVPGSTLRDLRILAGRAKPSEYEQVEEPSVPQTSHPIADEVDRLLADDSYLEPSERDLLTTLLDRVLEPYRTGTRRRTA